jgi:putative ABC transport system permease protein
MFPIGEMALREFPEVEDVVRFTRFYSSPAVTFRDQNTTLSGILFADSSFFSIFSFEFLAGNPDQALLHTGNIVLNESTARRLAGDPLDALHQMITIQDETYQVSGIMKDLPDNTHFAFNAVARQERLPDQIKASGTNFFTYLKLNPDTDISALEDKLDHMVADHVAHNPIYDGLHFIISNKLMRVSDIHLHSNLIWELRANGRYRNVVIFSLLGVFILLIAIINYVNLATARSTLRSKEIGLRKVVGASRRGLITQIIAESLAITVISFLLAFAFAEIASGYFSQALGITFKTSVFLSTKGLVLVASILILTTLLAGLYPAFFMASFNPVKNPERGRGKRQQRPLFPASPGGVPVCCYHLHH